MSADSAVAPLTRPPRLSPGDRVALVAPSGPVQPERLAQGRAILESWGLEVRVLPHVTRRHSRFDYLAGDDAERAEDLQQAWSDPDVAAVMCARGGYGAQRMVDLVDWDRMRAAPPKAFTGFSDTTALHEAFAAELGIATFYAPLVAGAGFVEDGVSAEALRRMLFHPDSCTALAPPRAQTLVAGTARGVTAGGCLTVLADSRGTPATLPSLAGAILLLEDVDEDCYRLDRTLTKLLRAGWFTGVAGIALGSWQDCGPDPATLHAMLLDRLGGLGVPIVAELGFGHGPRAATVPLGVVATLDADAAELRFDLPPLR